MDVPSNTPSAEQTTTPWLPGLVSFVVCAYLASAGCAPQEPQTGPEEASQPQVQHQESGPVRLTLTCDKSQAKLAEPILLEFAVEHPADLRVVWPPVEGDWGGFALTPETSQTQPDSEQQTVRTTKRYRLRPLQAGQQTIPELTLRLVSSAQPDTDAADAVEIVTRPIDLEVISVLTGNEEPDTVLQAEGTPVELPQEQAFPWKSLVAALLALVLLGAGGYCFLRWLRDRQPPPVIIPAHRWALDELDRLANSDLIARGDLHEYYFRLSAILRGYLERRFGILAPEMTTEEFVDYMRSDRALEERHRRSLGPFLESCDLVKFARHVPGRGDIDNAFGHARSFVIDTADYGGSEAGASMAVRKSGREAAA